MALKNRRDAAGNVSTGKLNQGRAYRFSPWEPSSLGVGGGNLRKARADRAAPRRRCHRG